MPARKRQRPRCPGCGLKPELCLCAELPRVQLDTPIVLVQHIRERLKPTNTGRLLARMIAGVEVLHFGQRDPPFDEAALHRSGVEFFVLFPRDDAHVLADDRPLADQLEVSAENRPGLVVLDGTWHQCSRMSRRVPGVDRLPCVALPAGPPGIWSVRRQHDPRGLSTFEATMRLLALAEPSDALAPLNAAFERVTARMLFMKGKLASPEVPHDWSSSRSRAPLGTTDELG